MSDTLFSTMLENANCSETGTVQTLPKDWLQGRAGYGGLMGALALKAMRCHVPPMRKVRSLLISFVGPVAVGDFSIHAKILREGKSITQVEAKLIQAGQICCTALGSFGEDRESVIRIKAPSRPKMTLPEKAMELPYIEGITPAFTRHFVYRWALGELPFSGKESREIGGWIRFRESTDCLSEEWLVALADAWPTPVLGTLSAPAPVSTITWELEFVNLKKVVCSNNDWWSYHCAADSAENGYVQERGAIWDTDGQLTAYSRQAVSISV